MDQIRAIASAYALPFVYLYSLGRMLWVLPDLMVICVRLRTTSFLRIAIPNMLSVVLLIGVAVFQAAIMPVLVAAGCFIRLMGEISGILAFSALTGLLGALLINPSNLADLAAVWVVFTACTAMAVVALVLWASNGANEEDDYDGQ